MRVCGPCGRGFMRRQSNDTGIPRQTSPRGFVVVDLPKEVLSSESEATEVVFATWIVVSIEIRESLSFKQHTLHHVQKATLLGRFPLNADFFAQYRACRFNRASCRSAFGRWSILSVPETWETAKLDGLRFRFYFAEARFQAVCKVTPAGVAGFVNFSSSTVSNVTIRFCSGPIRLENVLASILTDKLFSVSLTE